MSEFAEGTLEENQSFWGNLPDVQGYLEQKLPTMDRSLDTYFDKNMEAIIEEWGLLVENDLLDLERRDVDAADLKHVVAAAAVDKVALLVLDIFVAGARPFAQESRPRLLAIVPIHQRAGRPAHLQFAHLAARFDDTAVVVDEADVIAGHRPPGGAVCDLA